MITLSIHFKSNKVHRYPKVKIFVDQDLMEVVELTSELQTVSFPIALEDGEHLLEIEHYGKTSDDTLVDEDDAIVDDTYFVVKNITIDKFDLPILVLWTSKLVPDWTGLERPDNFPDELPQVLEVGTNGFWKLPFYTPIADWFISRRKESTLQLKKIKLYESYEPSAHSVIDYQLTDEDFALIANIKELLND